MPRYAKEPHLYLRRRAGREPVWVIKDGAKETSTGFGISERSSAVERLKKYYEEDVRPDTTIRNLSEIAVMDVLRLYAMEVGATSKSKKVIRFSIQALEKFWYDKTLADVKGSTCRAYTIQRTSGKQSFGSSQKSVTASTVRRELKYLNAAINHWHRESPLAAVPKVTLPPQGARRERVLERSEVARMLWAARKLKLHHIARFILIGVYTGTRHDAMLNLRWNSNLIGGHADIERGIIFRRGSAERETSKRRPPVQCPLRLARSLSRWRKMDRQAFPDSTIIHVNGQPIKSLYADWYRVVKEAGLGRDVVPHVTRHTCATWLLWEGKTVWEVAGFIGASAAVVEAVYGHHKKI